MKSEGWGPHMIGLVSLCKECSLNLSECTQRRGLEGAEQMVAVCTGGRSPHQDPPMLALSAPPHSPQNCEEISARCLSHPICSTVSYGSPSWLRRSQWSRNFLEPKSLASQSSAASVPYSGRHWSTENDHVNLKHFFLNLLWLPQELLSLHFPSSNRSIVILKILLRGEKWEHHQNCVMKPVDLSLAINFWTDSSVQNFHLLLEDDFFFLCLKFLSMKRAKASLSTLHISLWLVQ